MIGIMQTYESCLIPLFTRKAHICMSCRLVLDLRLATSIMGLGVTAVPMSPQPDCGG